MDGVLIDSEPFWRQAEMEVFATVGIHLTEQQCTQTQGIRIDEVVALHYAAHPWAGPSQQAIAEKIVERVAQLVRQRGKPMTGVQQILGWLQARQTRLALATGSCHLLIEAVLDTLGIRHSFSIVQSAEHETYGKPHPAVYLKTAQNLGLDPSQCLVIEDSVNGVIAAKAARMAAVAIPETHLRQDPRYGVADFQYESLTHLLDDLIAGNEAL